MHGQNVGTLVTLHQSYCRKVGRMPATWAVSMLLTQSCFHFALLPVMDSDSACGQISGISLVLLSASFVPDLVTGLLMMALSQQLQHCLPACVPAVGLCTALLWRQLR